MCADSDIVTWQRVSHFQLVTLQKIAASLLYACPTFSDASEPPKLFVRGDVQLESLVFDEPLHVYVSRHNPGGMRFAAELEQRYGAQSKNPKGFNLRFTETWNPRESNVFMLLYLNAETFVGDASGRLAADLRRAAPLDDSLFVQTNGARSSVPIVLVHEQDPDHGACPFSRFFQLTPNDLIIDYKLYGPIAVALQPVPFRDVSLALVAKELGAVKSRRHGFLLFSDSFSRSRMSFGKRPSKTDPRPSNTCAASLQRCNSKKALDDEFSSRSLSSRRGQRSASRRSHDDELPPHYQSCELQPSVSSDDLHYPVPDTSCQAQTTLDDVSVIVDAGNQNTSAATDGGGTHDPVKNAKPSVDTEAAGSTTSHHEAAQSPNSTFSRTNTRGRLTLDRIRKPKGRLNQNNAQTSGGFVREGETSTSASADANASDVDDVPSPVVDRPPAPNLPSARTPASASIDHNALHNRLAVF